VFESEEVAQLVRALLGYPLHQVVLARLAAIVVVPQPGRRDHGRPAPGPGKAEDELLAGGEEVVGDDEEHGILPSPAVTGALEAAEEGRRAVLPAKQVEPGQQEPVGLDHAPRRPQDRLDPHEHRALEPLRRAVIPIEGKTHRSRCDSRAH